MRATALPPRDPDRRLRDSRSRPGLAPLPGLLARREKWVRHGRGRGCGGEPRRRRARHRRRRWAFPRQRALHNVVWRGKVGRDDGGVGKQRAVGHRQRHERVGGLRPEHAHLHHPPAVNRFPLPPTSTAGRIHPAAPAAALCYRRPPDLPLPPPRAAPASSASAARPPGRAPPPPRASRVFYASAASHPIHLLRHASNLRRCHRTTWMSSSSTAHNAGDLRLHRQSPSELLLSRPPSSTCSASSSIASRLSVCARESVRNRERLG